MSFDPKQPYNNLLIEKLGVLAGERKGHEIVYKHPALLMVLTA